MPDAPGDRCYDPMGFGMSRKPDTTCLRCGTIVRSDLTELHESTSHPVDWPRPPWWVRWWLFQPNARNRAR